MDREIINLPCGFFGPTVSDWILNVRGKAASEGVTGVGQVIYGNQPRWEATLDLSGFGRSRVLAWRAIRARMRGRINILRVCVCDRWKPKFSELGLSIDDIALLGGPGIPHEGSGGADVFFSNDIGYEYASALTIAADVSAGANSVTIDATGINDALQPGQWFSFNDWPYQVTHMEGVAAARIYYFEPPLRRPILAGATMKIGEASGLFAFTDDLQGRMPLQLGKHGDTQIQLIEWTNRP